MTLRISIILATILLAAQCLAADQVVLDFCHKYIGEAIKPQVPERSLSPLELVQPIHRGKIIFNSFSTMRGTR